MAKDKYHDHVRLALENDGWTITNDPLRIPIGRRKAYIDLGAERLIIGALKGTEKIAVEIKTFAGASDIQDFDQAIGQFTRYGFALRSQEPDRKLFLAIPNIFFNRFFDDVFFIELLDYAGVSSLVYDEENPIIVKWIK
jgi:XisH protein